MGNDRGTSLDRVVVKSSLMYGYLNKELCNYVNIWRKRSSRIASSKALRVECQL